MDHPYSQSGEERAFRDAVGVEVDGTCHGLIEELVQLPILYTAIDLIYAVFFQAMIRRCVGGLKRYVSEATALATQSSLTTVSFCSPCNKS